MRKRTWSIMVAIVALTAAGLACRLESRVPQSTNTSVMIPNHSPGSTSTPRPRPTDASGSATPSEPAETPGAADAGEGQEEGQEQGQGQEEESANLDESAASRSSTWEGQARAIRLDVEAFCADFSRRVEGLSGLEDVDQAYDRLDVAFEEINKARSELDEAREALYQVRDELHQARADAQEEQRQQAEQEKEEQGQEPEQELEEQDQQEQAQLAKLSRIDGGLSPGSSEPGEELRDWYRRLPDNYSIEQSGWSRAKYAGVYFAIAGVGESRIQVADTFEHSTFNGVPIDGPLWGTTYDNLGFALLERHDVYELVLHMPENKTLGGPFGGFIEVPVEGASYGTVAQGDYVFADTGSRQVFVNGELRAPQ